MSFNPFASYNVVMPSKYQDKIKSFCQTDRSSSGSYQMSPFKRQIDFWYCSFVLAVRKNLEPIDEKDVYNFTPASILSTDEYRITHIQAVYFAINDDLESLADHRKVFNFAIQMANAGIPYLIQILDDSDGKPLWNLLDSLESFKN